MNNSTPSLSKNDSRRRRNAFLVVGVYTFAGILVSGYFLFRVIQDPSWQIWAATATTLAIAVAWAVSLFLLRRGRVDLGVWVTVIASYIGVIGITVAISGMGALFLISSVFLSAMVAIETLQTRQATMIVAGIVMGIIFILMDTFLPWERISAAGLQSLIIFILPVMLVVFGFVIFRQFRDYSLRVKLVVSIIPVTVVSIVVFSVISNNIAAAQISVQVGQNLGALADGDVRDVTDSLDSDLGALTVLALNKYVQETVMQENPARPSDIALIESIDKRWSRLSDSDPLVQDVIADELSVELREFQSAFPHFIEVFATDQYGAVLSSSGRTSDYYQADEDWWQKAWNNGKGGIYIGGPIFVESANVYAIEMAVPITAHDKPDELGGVLHATIDINRLATLIAASHFGETGKAEIIFQNNQILEHGETALVAVDAETRAVIDALSGEYVQVEYEGIPSLVSKKPIVASLSPYKEIIDRLGWVVVAHQDLAEAQSPISTARNTNMMIAIFVVIVMAVAAIGIAQIVSNPLVRLTAVAGKVAAGDIAAQATVESSDEIGALASAFNTMTARLRDFIATLEQRVAERTQSLELAADVGRSISQVRNLEDMLRDAAEIIRSRFNLYYTQVYLTNPGQNELILRAGTGLVGEQLIGLGHRLPINAASINGRAAVEKRPVVISDTSASATFRPNPLLPDTRSEMAVPLLIGDKVVGVLDLQSQTPGSLSQEILPAFEALAGQLAVAIQNANLLAETEQARAEVEKAARRLVRENWQDYLDAIHKPERVGFAFEGNQIVPLTDVESGDSLAGGHAVLVPIAFTGEPLGSLVIEMKEENKTPQNMELVNIVARQVGQQIENLRLLESAERYRLEADQAAQRATIEGWQEFMRRREGRSLGYLYDTREVRPVEGEPEDPALTLPLKTRDQAIGKLSIQGISAGDQDSLELANAVAERLSAHIESLRLFEETKRGQVELDKRARELEAVAEISTVSSREVELQRMLETVVYLTQRRFGLYHAHVFVFNEQTKSLDIVACGWKQGDEHEGTHGTAKIPLDQEQSLVARAGRMLRPVIVNDTRSDPGWLPNPLLPDTASEMAIPLVVGDQLLGVLDVQSDRRNAFTEEDASIQATLAAQVATSMQNARSFANAQKQAQREAMLNAISQKIQSATTVEAVLQIAARELGHALGAPLTVAQLGVKDRD